MLSTDRKSSTSFPSISFIAFITALSSALSIVEDLLFPAVPLPGVSFGLNNAVFLIVLKRLNVQELMIAQALKVLISGFFLKGLNLTSLFLSFSGALASTIALVVYKKYLFSRGFSLVTASVLSASVHLTAQIFASSLILKNSAPFAYLPFSGTASVFLGAFVGVISNLAASRLR